MHDTELIAGLLDGDREVVEQVRTWIRASSAPYRAQLGPDLEDLEQEALIDLSRALGTDRFRGASQLRTYVRAYVHHKCIDRLRAAKRREWLAIDELDLPSDAPSQQQQIEGSEAAELALRVVEEMPESCRELWRMLQDGMRYKDMSRRLGVAEGTLRARVLRCRRRALEVRTRLLSGNRVTKPKLRRLGR